MNTSLGAKSLHELIPPSGSLNSLLYERFSTKDSFWNIGNSEMSSLRSGDVATISDVQM